MSNWKNQVSPDIKNFFCVNLKIKTIIELLSDNPVNEMMYFRQTGTYAFDF